jgi:NADH-quinone oxidoreductase subunit J
MVTPPVLFYIFSAILLFGAFRVITARNTVHSALFLVLSFFSASCLWMLLRAEFLAISLVLVYVGAVMVLFLFVVMMLDTQLQAERQGFWRHFPLAALVGVVIALELAAVLLPGFRVSEVLPEDAVALKMGNTKLLGIELYTHYLYPLEIAAVILLVAMIAAIALTLRRRKDSKYTNPAEQVKVRKVGRVRIIKMAPQVEKQVITKVEPIADVASPLKTGGAA